MNILHKTRASATFVALALEALFIVTLSLYLFKILLGCAAKRTFKIRGQILKLGLFGDTVFGVSDLGVVFVTAELTDVDSHNKASHSKFCLYDTVKIKAGSRDKRSV